ncbi:MAG TPA: hypothetical protein VG839_08945 [Asticcacaulis sp.]|nr:hypothetical protein [Asticcacaulis sp.]
MTAVPLRLGPLSADGYNIFRSGLRWLLPPGSYCRANQPFAYCNISLEATGMRMQGPPPFAEEMELQVAFAPRVGGIVRAGTGAERGGYLSIRGVDGWEADTVVAHLETEAKQVVEAGQLRLLMLAGRRFTGLADVHSGLLPGWHGRSRGWWGDAGETPVTLLSLGICDATGVVLGEHCAFLEMFEAAADAAQMVFVPDHPLAPSAPVLLDQIERTPAQYQALADDLRRYLSDSSIAPTGDDWMVAGALLSVMQKSPIQDSYSLFTPSGPVRAAPAETVLLSLSTEPQSILRHKRLGYHVQIMRHHQQAAGPAFRAWLSSAFEPVKRGIDDIRRDYERLLDTMHARTGARALVINRMSTSGYEDISSYAPFDAPMSDTLSSIAAKELNLMLHDLTDSHDLAIIDVDALAADMGGAEHLPDGIHQSGPIQAALRNEILHVLQEVRMDQVTSNSTARSPASPSVASSG